MAKRFVIIYFIFKHIIGHYQQLTQNTGMILLLIGQILINTNISKIIEPLVMSTVPHGPI